MLEATIHIHLQPREKLTLEACSYGVNTYALCLGGVTFFLRNYEEFEAAQRAAEIFNKIMEQSDDR
jgi:hypothetical protein